jgi:hypothetical protein
LTLAFSVALFTLTVEEPLYKLLALSLEDWDRIFDWKWTFSPMLIRVLGTEQSGSIPEQDAYLSVPST